MYERLFIAILIASMVLCPSTLSRQSLNLTPLLRTASSQEKERSVEKLWHKSAPLKIGTIKTKKGEIILGKKFVDDDEWFRGLSVVLENISGKTITYIGAGFLFPRQVGDAGEAPPLYKALSYGLHPDVPEDSVINNQPLALKPGEKIAITLFDPDYFEVKNDLTKLEYIYSIKTIKFNLGEVYFDDGTSWVAGNSLPHKANKTRRSIQEQPPLSSISRSPFSFLGHSFRANKLEKFPAFF
ncbi:MAG: hypothetical protein QOH25_2617 [Acidobacteriota bacterium]|jgi:hypothetical protein|nr:hypothetical protein [Acidobacteriota bacterium]